MGKKNKIKDRFRFFKAKSPGRLLAFERLHRKTACRAQATVEYALLLALIAGVSLGVMRGLNDSIGRGFMRLNAELEKSLVSGSFQQNGVNIHQSAWVR